MKAEELCSVSIQELMNLYTSQSFSFTLASYEEYIEYDDYHYDDDYDDIYDDWGKNSID